VQHVSKPLAKSDAGGQITIASHLKAMEVGTRGIGLRQF
jgi:hypothetical protein